MHTISHDALDMGGMRGHKFPYFMSSVSLVFWWARSMQPCRVVVFAKKIFFLSLHSLNVYTYHGSGSCIYYTRIYTRVV